MGDISNTSRCKRFIDEFNDLAVARHFGASGAPKGDFIKAQGLVYDSTYNNVKYGYTIIFNGNIIEEVQCSDIIFDPNGNDVDNVTCLFGMFFNIEVEVIIEKFAKAGLLSDDSFKNTEEFWKKVKEMGYA